MKRVKFLIVFFLPVLLSCAAIQTAVRYRELETSVNMSDTIFLRPSKMAKTVFIQVKNTSKYQFDFTEQLRKKLQEKGYTVVEDPDRANYWIQANVLYVGRIKRTASDRMVADGYGGALAGALIGASAAVAADSGSTTTAIATAAGAAAGAIAEDTANALVGVVNYSGIVDLLVSERTEKPFEEEVESSITQGKGSKIVQKIKRKTNFIQYKTRIGVNATKRNLKFEEALPRLKEEIATCIAGIF